MKFQFDMAPHQTYERRIDIRAEDINEGKHVAVERYFSFIYEAFRLWYRVIGVGTPGRPGYSYVMAHLEYDFLREVGYPGAILFKLRVARAGRTSMEHAFEIYDVSKPDAPLLAGRGKSIHVWLSRSTGRGEPWPADLLAMCWDGETSSPRPA